MKQAKQRLIYDNYDLWETYSQDAREYLEENHKPEEITDSMIWDEIYFQDRVNWEDELENLKQWFVGYRFLLCGTVGRWNGSFAAGTVFDDFEKTFYEAIRDCDYWKIWDENGHLYIKCSHHDGTNFFEIKRITERGCNLLEKWEYDYDDPRTEEQIHWTIWNNNFYSALPHFAHNMYGCRKRETA